MGLGTMGLDTTTVVGDTLEVTATIMYIQTIHVVISTMVGTAEGRVTTAGREVATEAQTVTQ